VHLVSPQKSTTDIQKDASASGASIASAPNLSLEKKHREQLRPKKFLTSSGAELLYLLKIKINLILTSSTKSPKNN